MIPFATAAPTSIANTDICGFDSGGDWNQCAFAEARAAIAQLGERQTEDLKVPGSIPGLGIFSFPGFAQNAVASCPRQALPSPWHTASRDGVSVPGSPRRVALTVWPSGLRRWLQAPVRKGVGSNPTAVIFILLACRCECGLAFMTACEATGRSEQQQRRQPFASIRCGRIVSERDFKKGTAAIAQLAARRSHNPKVVSSILTRRTFSECWLPRGDYTTKTTRFRKRTASDPHVTSATN